MGLDIVELILAVEDAFQIHIADEEANAASTVGDLYNLVVAKVQGQDSKRCLTSAAFYRTRRCYRRYVGNRPAQDQARDPSRSYTAPGRTT